MLRKKFTKLYFITKFYDKSTFSKSVKIIKISYIMQVWKVGRWYSSNKSEETQVFKHVFGKIANSVYLTVKRSNLIEFICFDATFVSAIRTMKNSCIRNIVLKSIIIS